MRKGKPSRLLDEDLLNRDYSISLITFFLGAGHAHHAQYCVIIALVGVEKGPMRKRLHDCMCVPVLSLRQASIGPGLNFPPESVFLEFW